MIFFQPGIFWPKLAQFMPIFVLSVLGLFFGVARKSTYSRGKAFTDPVFVWLVIFILIQPVSLLKGGGPEALSGLSFWAPYLIFVVVSITLIADVKTFARYVCGMMVGSMFIVIFGICAVLS
jgi:hypothetical protein